MAHIMFMGCLGLLGLSGAEFGVWEEVFLGTLRSRCVGSRPPSSPSLGCLNSSVKPYCKP